MGYGLLSDDKFEKDLLLLMRRTETKLDPEKFINAVSNVYHEVESNYYDELHTEIIEAEVNRLKKLFAKTIKERTYGLRIADIGCGTGHASKILVDFLAERHIEIDALCCVDLSQPMLNICKQKLSSTKNLILIEGSIDHLTTDKKFDLVITSSVLHHIPNIFQFSKKVSELLDDGGLWIMSHEPLEQKKHMMFVRSSYRKMASLLKRISYRLSKKYPPKTFGPHILDVVSEKLVSLSITPASPLTRREVRGLIDIHTPKIHPGTFAIGYEGFNIITLMENYKKNGLSLQFFESYNQISSDINKSYFVASVEKMLHFLFPKSGILFSALWKKESDIW